MQARVFNYKWFISIFTIYSPSSSLHCLSGRIIPIYSMPHVCVKAFHSGGPALMTNLGKHDTSVNIGSFFLLLFCAVYCTVLYCTVLCCAILHCTISYNGVLYCTILCSKTSDGTIVMCQRGNYWCAQSESTLKLNLFIYSSYRRTWHGQTHCSKSRSNLQ